MPVSPTVKQHQQSIVQQSTTPEQLTFNKEFGEAAYELLNSKFPRLVPFTITFKIIEGGADKDYGVGSFIIARGNDVEYIPVILQGGSISSCEMIYNKEEDSFKPLSAKEVKAIIAANRSREHTIVKSPNVETTKEVFKNMFRPPMSSNPVLASSKLSLEILPNDARTTLSDYLQDHPDTLAKIASFYDVEVLADRLAVKPEDPVKQASEEEEYAYFDKVIKLDELTEKTAEQVREEYPDVVEDLLEDGYAVLSVTEATVTTLPSDKIDESIETGFNAIELGGGGYSRTQEQYGTGNILKHTEDGFFRQEPCLVAGHKILSRDMERSFTHNPVVLTDYTDDISFDDVVTAMGRNNVFSPQDLPSGIMEEPGVNYHIMYPTRNGSLKRMKNCYTARSSFVSHVDDVTTIKSDLPGTSYTFTPEVSYGYIEPEGSNVVILPANSVIITITSRSRSDGCITTLSSLRTLLEQKGIKLQYHKDGPDYNLIDRTFNKTAKFKSEADLVHEAVSNYGMDKEGIDSLLENKRVHLIKKASAMPMAQGMAQGRGQGQPIPMGSSEQPATTPMGNNPGFERKEEPLVIDESLLEESAEMEDQDMMDMGMIASLASNSDIKSILVDFVADFENTTTELGKAVLVFVINEQEFQDQYGREEYSTVLNKIRSVFTGLGDILFDLNEYINNQTYSEGV